MNSHEARETGGETGRPAHRRNRIDRSLYQSQFTDRANSGLMTVISSFGELPDPQTAKLHAAVRQSLTGVDGDKRADFLTALFHAKDTYDFKLRMKSLEGKIQQIPDLIQDEGMYTLMTVMLDHPERHRMQLGMFLSQTRLDRLPKNLQDQLPPRQPGLDLTLSFGNMDWSNCDSSEDYLAISMGNRLVTAIVDEHATPFLLFKGHGWPTALCVRSVTTAGGQGFRDGCWYSPTDAEVAIDLYDALDSGKGRKRLNRGNWALMRGMDVHSDNFTAYLGLDPPPDPIERNEFFLRTAKDFADTTPDQYSNLIVVNGRQMTRRNYRLERREDFE